MESVTKYTFIRFIQSRLYFKIVLCVLLHVISYDIRPLKTHVFCHDWDVDRVKTR